MVLKFIHTFNCIEKQFMPNFILKDSDREFPIAMISQSVHQMCAHSWELFAMTDEKPIASYAKWGKMEQAHSSLQIGTLS